MRPDPSGTSTRASVASQTPHDIEMLGVTAIVVAQVVLRQGAREARRARRGEATEGAGEA